MLRLKDRQKSVPNGFSFYLPELKWSAPKNFPSFTIVADGLQRVVQGNSYLAAKNKWPTDRKGIEDWVDLYNATVCARMGWDDYIVNDQGPSVPKSSPHHQQQTLQNLASAVAATRLLVSGAKTLIEWIDSGSQAVSPETALERAITCSKCPHNAQGGYDRWFTAPASELIRRQVQKLNNRKLATERDEQLNICDICHCPLKLKVWTPKEWILKHMSQETLAKLAEVPGCWVAHDDSTSAKE